MERNMFVKAMSNIATTANGAVSNASTFDASLDFFAKAGDQKEMLDAFLKSYQEDKTTAARILFWSRDCRGGAGAKANFHACMRYLQENEPEVFSKLFKFIPEYGYWRDIFAKLTPSEELVEFVSETIMNDVSHSLCAKFMPRKGAWFGLVRKFLGISAKELRKVLVAKTQVVEQLMCQGRWSEINFAGVPSRASMLYASAFRRQDEKRYSQYLEDVLNGKTHINASVLFPCDVFHMWNSRAESSDVIARWNALPNYMEGCTERILPLVDVSGSMYGKPIEVSVSLGAYISEKNEGEFKDVVLTFETSPHFAKLDSSKSICDRFKEIMNLGWDNSTNLQAAFDLILSRAIAAKVPASQMPTKLLIISDMQFDEATGMNTNLEVIREKYRASGYDMPGIIFWNVNGKAGEVPATMNDFNVGLVSGYSPAIMQAILQAKVLSPVELMRSVIDAPRYEQIIL